MISTKGRYAVRVMIDLAEHGGRQKNIPLKDIAERQELSKKYLEIIVKDLVAAGLVAGVSGKGGGYRLCRKPEEYNIGEILTLMEGTLSSVACLADGEYDCPRQDKCHTLPMWTEYDQMVNDFFKNKRLSDLIGRPSASPDGRPMENSPAAKGLPGETSRFTGSSGPDGRPMENSPAAKGLPRESSPAEEIYPEDSDESLVWEEVKTEHIIQDKWIDFRRSKFRFPDGSEFEPYYSYSRRDYVVIVPRDTEGNYLCVRQYRYGIRQVTTEFPAGGIERKDGKEYGGDRDLSSEDALSAAKRELLEETGYESDDWSPLLTIPSEATIADNYGHIFFADQCRKVSGQDLDDTEFLNVHRYSPARIEEMIKTGNFQQAMHVMAWLLAQRL